MRVSVSVPAQRGRARRGRASVQRTSPSGSSAASSFARVATTKRPNGDQLASRYAPSSRFEPFGSRPTARRPRRRAAARRRGQREQRGLRALDADCLANRSITARPGGLSAAPRTRRRSDDRGNSDQPRRDAAVDRLPLGERREYDLARAVARGLGAPAPATRSSSRLTAAPASRRARAGGAS